MDTERSSGGKPQAGEDPDEIQYMQEEEQMVISIDVGNSFCKSSSLLAPFPPLFAISPPYEFGMIADQYACLCRNKLPSLWHISHGTSRPSLAHLPPLPRSEPFSNTLDQLPLSLRFLRELPPSSTTTRKTLLVLTVQIVS
jgi:hypothetical protein